MLHNDAVFQAVDVGHHGLGAVVEGDIDMDGHQIAILQRQNDVVLVLALEEDVGNEVHKTLTALLHSGLIFKTLDCILDFCKFHIKVKNLCQLHAIMSFCISQ